MTTLRTPAEVLDHAARTNKEVELRFPSEREAYNFRWRMYRIRKCKAEWVHLTLRQNQQVLTISPPPNIEVMT